jgi:hypothetical protein
MRFCNLAWLATTFDRERGLLYVLEPLADEERSIVHVWQVTG